MNKLYYFLSSESCSKAKLFVLFSVILENPAIAFTHVAAEKGQSLSNEQRERYQEIARETASTRKVSKLSLSLIWCLVLFIQIYSVSSNLKYQIVFEKFYQYF